MQWSRWDWRFSTVKRTPQTLRQPISSYTTFPLTKDLWLLFALSVSGSLSLCLSLFVFLFLVVPSSLSYWDRLSYSYCIPYHPCRGSHRTQMSRRNLIPPLLSSPSMRILDTWYFLFHPYPMRSTGDQTLFTYKRFRTLLENLPFCIWHVPWKFCWMRYRRWRSSYADVQSLTN